MPGPTPSSSDALADAAVHLIGAADAFERLALILERIEAQLTPPKRKTKKRRT